ncbi:MAG TPA: hypothetical protein EYG85_01565 [Crocinitomix sp.]|nr:hypothetical protein [Crocinitomix sp.]
MTIWRDVIFFTELEPTLHNTGYYSFEKVPFGTLPPLVISVPNIGAVLFRNRVEGAGLIIVYN